jgi:hypothetical protein
MPALNLSIPNPSNLTLNERSLMSSNYNVAQLISKTDSSVCIKQKMHSDGTIQSFDIMPVSSSFWGKPSESFSLKYSDILNIQPVDIKDTPTETPIGNGSIAVEISISVNNTENRPLVASNFPLFPTWTYGNLTSYLSFVNGTQQSPPINDGMVCNGGWLWLDWGLYVPANSTMNIVVNTVFGGKT